MLKLSRLDSVELEAICKENLTIVAFGHTTLQMFAGIYGGFIGKSECGDFKFMGIACNPQSL